MIVQTSEPIMLLGGGDVGPDDIGLAGPLSGPVVAADGGALHALAAGLPLRAVIGDMDSLSADDRAALPAGTVHEIADQTSTDFDKCLRHVAAPLVIGLGFLGARMDHQMAVQNGLVRHPDKRCILLGAEDVLFLCPPVLRLDLPRGTRVSLFPMGAVEGWSEGLHWPLRGITFAPDGVIGTSNRVTGPMTLNFTAPKMLCLLPRGCFELAVRALREQPGSWPAP